MLKKISKKFVRLKIRVYLCVKNTRNNMEEQKYCYVYPHPAVTTDCVIFGFDGTKLKVLLIERGIDPYKGKWALPGGFLRMDESAEQGALRELNSTNCHLLLKYITTPLTLNDSFRVSCINQSIFILYILSSHIYLP